MIELYEIVFDFGHVNLSHKMYSSSDENAIEMAKVLVAPFVQPKPKKVVLYRGDDEIVWRNDVKIEYKVSYEVYDDSTDEYTDFGTDEYKAMEFFRFNEKHRKINRYFDVYEDEEECPFVFESELEIKKYAEKENKPLIRIYDER